MNNTGGNGGNYVSQQEMAMELATVKADLLGQVDMLQSQLNYWLKIKDSSKSGEIHSSKQTHADKYNYSSHSFKW